MSQVAAFKPYFLGPKSENETWVRARLDGVLDDWFAWRKSLFADDPRSISAADQAAAGFALEQSLIGRRLAQLVSQLRGEAPIYSPRYIGHMVS